MDEYVSGASAIYFRVHSAIEIFAVFHARRDPRDLRRHLRQG